MVTYIIIGSLLYLILLINLPLLPNKSPGITHLKAIRALLLIPLIGFLFFLTVFRSFNVGTDYSMYYLFFSRGDYAQSFDLFIILIYDFARNRGDFLLFTYIITGLFLLFNLIAIKKITFNFLVSFTFFILSFYFFYIFNGMRQAVAISVVFIAIYFIQKEKMRAKDYFLYFVLILMAAQFHVSAWFMLPLILLRFFKINKAVIFIAFVLTGFGYFTPFIKDVLDDALLIFDFYATKYENTLDQFFSVNKEKSLSHFIPVVIQYSFLYYSLIIKKPQTLYEKFLTNYYLVFLFLYSASGVEAIDRIQFYFYPSIILFYDYLIHSIYTIKGGADRKGLLPVSKMVAMISISFWFLYFVLRVMQGTGGINPYEFMG